MLRKSNLELLRIISMMAIVSCHFWLGDFSYSHETITFNRVLCQVSGVGGGFGNICFILISGYFMVDSEFKFKRIFRVWLEMLFYSVGCLIAVCLLSGSGVGVGTAVKAFFPFATCQYWFMTEYIILMFLSPYLNVVIRNISKEQHKKLLFILFVFTSVIPTMPGCPQTVFSAVGFYIFIYLIAAYMRLYSTPFWEKQGRNVGLGLCSFAVILVSVLVMDFFGMRMTVFAQKATFLVGQKSPFVLICAISCFMFFRNMEIPYSKFINYIAKSTLAIYLIHSNQNFRDYMWSVVFQNSKYADAPFLFFYELACTLIIMIICTLIDIARRECLEKTFFSMVNRWGMMCNNVEEKGE